MAGRRPPKARGESDTTATDIYRLGVLLGWKAISTTSCWTALESAGKRWKRRAKAATPAWTP